MKNITLKPPVLTSGEVLAKRQEILDYFRNTYALHESLYDQLVNDAVFFQRANSLRHPLIFYFGHTAVFFMNKLVLAKLVKERPNPRFESIFAIGVDEMSWDDLNEAHYDWPTVQEVREYRAEVREIVENLIRSLPLELPITWESPFWAVVMGIEHERIHLETSSVLIRELPLDKVRKQDKWKVCGERGDAPQNNLLAVPAGKVILGRPTQGTSLYGWDNEFGQQEEQVGDFKASQFVVSNAEFKQFVDAGGYEHRDFWTEEGWNWVQFKKSRYPQFWRESDGQFKLRLVTEEVEMPWNWPVEVNQLEAKAFCNWKSQHTGLPIRLPSEEEWVRLHEHVGLPNLLQWDKAPGNLNLEHFASSCPVDKFESGLGFYDVIGNVWQWTETPIFGYPGFKVHPLYDDFSTPTFDGKHNLFKGGSWISTGNEATKDARYAFRRHFYQHAGFRYVESKQPVVVKNDIYETNELISQYCEFHFGKEYFGVPNYPKQCAQIGIDLLAGKPKRRALDLGCAVGRSTFELAKAFDQVTGIDFSARFIRIAIEMQEKGYTQYVLPEEGELISFHQRSLDELGLDGLSNKVDFFQGDASNLKPQFANYDLVFAGNLIDRLYDPAKFLSEFHERIVPGGILLLSSPYTWLEGHTKKENWLGGYKRNGENITTLDGLHELLDAHFELVGQPANLEFVIRETARKFQHTVSQVTAWRKL